MKRFTLTLFLGCTFIVSCGQRLIDLTDDPTPPPATAPTLIAVQPQRGVPEGGTAVVITGTGLSDAIEVAFGSTAAAFTVESATRIAAISPGGTGTVSVTVTTGGGRSNGLPFAYGNAPIITTVAPATGLAAGGETITITGSAFTDTTSVSFGGTAASSFTVDSDTQITASTPAHDAGRVALVVTTSVSASNSFDFVYGVAPTLESIAPSVGPTTGGTLVTLTGTNLTSATAVTFGATEVTTLEVIDEAHLRVTAPAHAEGDVEVSVTTTFSTSSAVTFTYGPTPTLESASPDVSSTAGGATVVLTGTGLVGATSVLFGTVEAASFTVDSPTQITVTSPAGADSVNITIVTPFGTSNGLAFRYGDAPAQTSLNPAAGLTTGGASVVITGSGLTGATAVTFDGISATSFVVDSDTQLTAVSPAHASGAVSVVTTTPFGASNPLTFTYEAPPTISSLSPASGPMAGGTNVVITGTGFVSATSVRFGSTPAPSFVVNSATQISAQSPSGVASVNVTVISPNGTSNGVEFTYLGAPTLTTVSPSSGPRSGGGTVTLTGRSFTPASTAFFGATSAATTFISSSQLSVVVPASAFAQTLNVSVQTEHGVSNTQPYQYVNAPTLSLVSPNNGSTAGATSVTLTGSGFTGTTSVTFGGTPAAFTVQSDSAVAVTTPAHPAGAVDIDVTSTGGTVTLSNGFTYIPD